MIPTAVLFLADEIAAERRIAGVSAIGRIVREIAAAGLADIRIVAPEGVQFAQRVLDDFDRLAPDATIRISSRVPEGEEVIGFASDYLLPAEVIARFLAGSERELAYADEPVAWRFPAPGGCMVADDAIPLDDNAGWELLRRTVKKGDGLVSRYINRRISRPISGFLLLFPFIRPVHATIGTALLGVAMLLSLLTGSHAGMVAGAILFQAASIFDGVDGEIARVTFRSSDAGASLDSAIDQAINISFILGLSYSLTLQGSQIAVYLGLWSVGAMALGLWLIGRKTLKNGKPLGFDLVKHKMRDGNFGPIAKAVIAFFTFLTARDGFAFLFAVVVVFGFNCALFALEVFAAVAVIWLATVLVAVLPRPRHAEAAEEVAGLR
ncbi:MAG: CDP-alcohol phosphatidyltransferase family protein [Novosphingobium sp.]|nr:CDP-alcohol phosphatidyltransferase family protein [Novosphingobium sp.]MBO9601519.1 CDP-alcohol phosphatidyltransferase family protein [Novosphingobium sp.]